jgi:hypothetical protein
MADYISRDEAIERIQPHVKPQTVYGEGYLQAIEHATAILELMPAADVQPVKQGTWENECYDEGLQCYIATCSECEYESTDKFKISESHRYCESCGADMIGGTDND